VAEVYRRLALVEEKHAQFWEQKLRAVDQAVPSQRPSWRSRTLSWFAKRWGPQFVLPTVARMEQVNYQIYDKQPEAQQTAMPAEERSHACLLRTIAGASPVGSIGRSPQAQRTYGL
jgi:hypothetical protein